MFCDTLYLVITILFVCFLRSTVDKPSQYQTTNEGTKIHHLRTNFIYDDPILREFIVDSNFIFKSLQDMKLQGSRAEYLKMSRSYRSVIRAYLEKLQEHIAFCETDYLSKYQSLTTVFYTIEFLWHLCEILIIDPTSSSMVVAQLIEWIRFHYPLSERMAGEFLVSGTDVESHESFWPVVKGQVMQGQLDVARALLKLHSASQTIPFQLAEQILKTLPVFNVISIVLLCLWNYHKFRLFPELWRRSFSSEISFPMAVLD